LKQEKIIAQLIKKAGKEKFLSQEDVLPFANPGSEDYFEIERALLNEDIDIITQDELEEVEDEDEEQAGVLEIDEDDEVDFDIEDDEPDDLSLSGLEVEEEELINIDTIASKLK
jgi:RNA polymerase primary sigma factor